MAKQRTKLIALLILALSLTLFAVFAAGVTASAQNAAVPKIALTYVPPYGDVHNFEGVVFTEDGSAFDTNAYRVTLYILSRYVKPTYDEPSVPVNSDGTFSLWYTSGGDATRTYMELMLIPADFTGTDYNAAKEAAVDYVEVFRSEDGGIRVVPERQAVTPGSVAPALPSGLGSVSRYKIAVDVGFYTDGAAPGSALSEDLIRSQLREVKKFSDTVRFYGASGELYKAYGIAKEMGFTVFGNAWLSSDKTANQNELDALIEHCNNGLCRVAVVGSEVLLRRDLSSGELTEAIEYVRERLTDKNIPVTTADSIDVLLSSPSVRNACNILMPNCYPYWSGSPIDQAAGNFISNIEALQAVSGGKEIVVSETGWPTAGEGRNASQSGKAEAAEYYSAIREWSLSANVHVLFFDAADEPWKARDEGTAGSHWGFMTNDLALKGCYAGLNPFNAELPGDVDGSWDLTAADARLALRASVGLENYASGTREFRAADVNKDGTITAEDARLLLRAAVGLGSL